MPDPATGADDLRAESERGPAVLIVGGLFTSWLWYWPVASHFARRGAARVAVAPLWLLDWSIAGFVGPARAASVVASSIDRLAAEDGRPIVVVGHSGGGILARLALARLPFDGTRLARRDAVGALVTLGTPHGATRFGGAIGRQGLRALRFLQDLDRTPGPADPWATMSVGGRLPPLGHSMPDRMRGAFTRMCYGALLGPKGRRLSGDGLVPETCALLPHGERLAIDGFAHAPFLGSPWYFSEKALDQWWGRARELWHAAVVPTPKPKRRRKVESAQPANLQSGG